MLFEFRFIAMYHWFTALAKCDDANSNVLCFRNLNIFMLQARVQEVVKIPTVDIAVPVNVKSQHKTKPPQPLSKLVQSSPLVSSLW